MRSAGLAVHGLLLANWPAATGASWSGPAPFDFLRNIFGTPPWLQQEQQSPKDVGFVQEPEEILTHSVTIENRVLFGLDVPNEEGLEHQSPDHPSSSIEKKDHSESEQGQSRSNNDTALVGNNEEDSVTASTGETTELRPEYSSSVAEDRSPNEDDGDISSGGDATEAKTPPSLVTEPVEEILPTATITTTTIPAIRQTTDMTPRTVFASTSEATWHSRRKRKESFPTNLPPATPPVLNKLRRPLPKRERESSTTTTSTTKPPRFRTYHGDDPLPRRFDRAVVAECKERIDGSPTCVQLCASGSMDARFCSNPMDGLRNLIVCIQQVEPRCHLKDNLETE